MLRRLVIDLAAVPAIALLWVGLYHLNGWIFSAFEETGTANWIFLPAALRLIAVLVAGWRGVLGLWFGTMASNASVFDDPWSEESLGAATVSALAPWLAVAMTRGRLDLRTDLSGLDGFDLMLLSVVCAICSALVHSAYLQWLGFDLATAGSPVTMFIGNVVGTCLALYLFKAVIAIHRRIEQ